jgi:hypothetical protein
MVAILGIDALKFRFQKERGIQMTLSDRIEAWLVDQEKAGRTRDDLHNTHFSDGKTIAVLKKHGRGYKLDIFLEPKVVFFE